MFQAKDLIIADALSRAPVCTPTAADELLQQEVNAYANFVVEHLPASEQHLQEFRQCQESDEVCQQITEFCQSGRPKREDLSAAVRPYLPLSAELTVQEGLLLRGGRIVVPPPLRKELLDRVHSGHQGITKCRELDNRSGGLECRKSWKN